MTTRRGFLGALAGAAAAVGLVRYLPPPAHDGQPARTERSSDRRRARRRARGSRMSTGDIDAELLRVYDRDKLFEPCMRETSRFLDIA